MDRRFVDQDVRDNYAYFDIAKAYVEQYTGEFPYLHEMRARVARGQDLTVPMVRGILNCMMGDPRVEVDLTIETTVTNLSTAYAKMISPVGRNPKVKEDCPLMTAGIYHSHNKQSAQSPIKWCPGLYRIDRYAFATSASTKCRYIVARQGGVIHKLMDLNCTWYPNRHKLGYMMAPSLGGTGECGTPWFREPRLVDTLDEVPDHRPKHQGEFLRPCKRCFPEEN